MIADLITISPEIQSGTPVFARTRVPIKSLFDYLKSGNTIEEFLNDYPSVRHEQVIRLLSLLEQHYTFTHEENLTGWKSAPTFGQTFFGGVRDHIGT